MEYVAKKLPFRLSCNTCDGKFVKAGIDVYFGTCCQNNCEFCSVQHSNSLNNEIMPWHQKPNIDGILKSINYYVKTYGCKFVHFMGGEPLLFPNELLDCISRLPPEIEQVRLATSLPVNVHTTEKETFFKILEHVNMLTVSIHSADLDMNHKMFRTNNTPECCDLIKEVSQKFPNIRIETNTVVTSKNFTNKQQIDDLVKKLSDANVTGIRLTEVMEYDPLYTELDKLMGVHVKAPYSHGCHIPVTIKELPDQDIFISKCCFKLSERQQAHFSDLIKALIRNTRYFKTHKLKGVKKGYGYGIFPDGSLFNEDSSTCRVDFEEHKEWKKSLLTKITMKALHNKRFCNF